MRTAGLIGAVWIMVFLAPTFINELAPRPEASLWVLLGVIYAWLIYESISAWSAGSRSSLIIRTTVPIALFATSYVLIWVGVWQWALGKIGVAA